MSKFHDLRVAEIRPETKDCVSIVLEVPAEKAKDFAFIQGQYAAGAKSACRVCR